MSRDRYLWYPNQPMIHSMHERIGIFPGIRKAKCPQGQQKGALVVDHQVKKVWAVEMSGSWEDNREKESEEKTDKHGQLQWNLKKQYPTFDMSNATLSTRRYWD